MDSRLRRGQQPRTPSGGGPLDLLRWVFLVAVLGCAWWGMRGRWGEVGTALAATAWWAVAVALALVLGGLLLTGGVWRALLRGFGRDLPDRDARAVFFVGQLGKYLPGSVWSIGVQAELARRHRVPLRTTVAASLMFLGVHVATGVVLAAVVALAGRLDVAPVPGWLLALALLGAVSGLSPWVLDRCGTAVAGGDRCRLGVRATGSLLVRQMLAWACYAGALTLLAPEPSVRLLLVAAGAFAASYAVGVVVVLAPAGVGAREVVLVTLLAPELGVTSATALALLARVIHTLADLLLAAGSWARARADGADGGQVSEADGSLLA